MWFTKNREKIKNVNRKVQEEPQAEVTANPQHQEEEKKWQTNVCKANKQMHDKHKDRLPPPQARRSKCQKDRRNRTKSWFRDQAWISEQSPDSETRHEYLRVKQVYFWRNQAITTKSKIYNTIPTHIRPVPVEWSNIIPLSTLHIHHRADNWCITY